MQNRKQLIDVKCEFSDSRWSKFMHDYVAEMAMALEIIAFGICLCVVI